VCFCSYADSTCVVFFNVSLHDALPIWNLRFLASLRPDEMSWGTNVEGADHRRRRFHRVASYGRLAADRLLGSHPRQPVTAGARRSEEHTSELQSRENLVCRLLLGKKKI